MKFERDFSKLHLLPNFIHMPPASRTREKCFPYTSEILTLLFKLSFPLFHENRTANVAKVKPKAVYPGQSP